MANRLPRPRLERRPCVSVLIGASGCRLGEARADWLLRRWIARSPCLAALWHRTREESERDLCRRLLGLDLSTIPIIDRRPPRPTEPEQMNLPETDRD